MRDHVCRCVFTSPYRGFGMELYVFCTGLASLRLISNSNSLAQPMSLSSIVKAPHPSFNIAVTMPCCSHDKWLRSTGGTHCSCSCSCFPGSRFLLVSFPSVTLLADSSSLFSTGSGVTDYTNCIVPSSVRLRI